MMDAKPWDYYFDLFKEYLDKHNNQYPEEHEVYRGVVLRYWIKQQRKIYNRGKIFEDGSRIYIDVYKEKILTKEQIDKLNEIDFSWTKHEEIWNKKFNLTLEYLNSGKKLQSRTVYKGVNIGTWFNTQKTIHNNGKKINGEIVYNNLKLTKEHLEKIQLLNPVWYQKEETFKINLKELKKYLKEHDGKYPPELELYNGAYIGPWVNIVRMIHNNGVVQKNGSITYNGIALSKKHYKQLINMNFKWVGNNNRFIRRTITTEGQLQGANRILLYKLEKVLLEEKKKSIESKEDIDNINNEFKLALDEK